MEGTMPLSSGDTAPDFTLAGVVADKISEVTLESLLAGRTSLTLMTYPLDFTGG
jgi:peroxiredoxin